MQALILLDSFSRIVKAQCCLGGEYGERACYIGKGRFAAPSLIIGAAADGASSGVTLQTSKGGAIEKQVTLGGKALERAGHTGPLASVTWQGLEVSPRLAIAVHEQ